MKKHSDATPTFNVGDQVKLAGGGTGRVDRTNDDGSVVVNMDIVRQMRTCTPLEITQVVTPAQKS